MFSNADVVIAGAVLQWARESLTTPNEKMRRRPSGPPEAVCPFVRPSMESDCFYIDIRHEVNGKRPEPIVEAMLRYRETLRGLPPFDAGEQQKKSMLVVFPDIPEEAASVLDLVHRQIKSEYVHSGLMVTQCYPGCDMRSKRNPELRVYQSPYPLMALRVMAIHDILFVGDDPEWFAAYSMRFGGKFRNPATLQDYEQPLLEEFARAKARFVR